MTSPPTSVPEGKPGPKEGLGSGTLPPQAKPSCGPKRFQPLLPSRRVPVPHSPPPRGSSPGPGTPSTPQHTRPDGLCSVTTLCGQVVAPAQASLAVGATLSGDGAGVREFSCPGRSGCCIWCWLWARMSLGSRAQARGHLQGSQDRHRSYPIIQARPPAAQGSEPTPPGLQVCRPPWGAAARISWPWVLGRGRHQVLARGPGGL